MKRKSPELSIRKLTNIFQLVYEKKYQEAIDLIPLHSRHLPLCLKEPPDTSYYSTWPLLHYAAMKGGYDLLEYLLDGGADIELKRERSTHTPLIESVIEGHEHCCELLLDRGANIEVRDYSRRTPLIIAIDHENEQMCKLLVRRGADINARTDDNWTPLHGIVIWNNVSIANLLLSNGARTDIRSYYNKTPLDYAKDQVRNNRSDLVQLFEDHSVTINLSGAISRGLIKESLFSGFLVFSQINDPRLLLIVASFAYNK